MKGRRMYVYMFSRVHIMCGVHTHVHACGGLLVCACVCARLVCVRMCVVWLCM